MKYLAIDYGTTRTGLAVSDPDGTCSFPITALTMRGKDAFFSDLLQFIEDEQIEAVVIGLPLTSQGEDTETTRMVRNMAARLRRRCSLPIYFMEEYLSSAEAEKRLKSAGKRGKEIALLVDQHAAAIILESFLRLSDSNKETLVYTA